MVYALGSLARLPNAHSRQLATHTSVGIDVAVHVEISLVAVQPLAHLIRHPADAQQIGRAVERHAVVEAEALAGLHFVADRLQTRVFKRRVSFQKDIGAQNTKNITLT